MDPQCTALNDVPDGPTYTMTPDYRCNAFFVVVVVADFLQTP